MVRKADIGGKRLISLAPDNWVRWVTQREDLQAREILGGDFQWINRDNDSLIRTYSPQDQLCQFCKEEGKKRR